MAASVSACAQRVAGEAHGRRGAPGYARQGQIGLRPCSSAAQSTVFNSRLFTPLNACSSGQPCHAVRAPHTVALAHMTGLGRTFRKVSRGELPQLRSIRSRCERGRLRKASQYGKSHVSAAVPPSANVLARHANSSSSLQASTT